MDDRIFFSFAVYMVISSVCVGMMPHELVLGVSGGGADGGDLENFVSANAIEDSPVKYSIWVTFGIFLLKMMVFIWATWAIEGIPVIIATMIFMLNMASLSVISIWIYDKARGIGS